MNGRKFSAGLAFALLLCAAPARANVPGGGTNGPNVTLTDNGSTVVLANGIVTATINKDSGEIPSLLYNGTEMVSTSGTKTKIYHDWTGTGWDATTNGPVPGAFETLGHCVYSVVVSNVDMVDVSFRRNYTPPGDQIAGDMEIHWVLRRGNTGLYCYSILEHKSSYPPVSLGSWRLVWWIAHDAVNNLCEKIYVDDLRHWTMPSVADYNAALATGIAEIVKLTTGVRAGKYDCKYEYSANLYDLRAYGHASDVHNLGSWIVFGSHEFFNNGPTYADLNAAAGIIHITLNGLHYNSPDFVIDTNQYWKKIYGPFLVFFNNKTGGDACWADAKAQADAEEAAWPYAWLTNSPDYPLAAGRGTVAGRFVLNDPLKPSVNASNAWVGLAAPTAADPYTGWEFQGTNYQFWTRADAAGNFTIPNVRPGTYTLYAFNDGAMGEYSLDGVVATPGATNQLGTLTRTVAHAGNFIAWEIGTPDRTAKEFRHGSTDWYEPYNWDNYAAEFSNPIEFNLGAGVVSNELNFAHCGYPATWTAWKWHLNFILPALPPGGNATLNFAWASTDHARMDISVNNDAVNFASFYPSMGGGNAHIREGIHAKYGTDSLTIPVANLRVGTNTITLNEGRAASASDHVMYDYINLELPAVPPLPANTDLEWKGGANGNAWDLAATANWTSNGVARVFNSGNRVIFDDYGLNDAPVILAATLTPGAVTIWANKSFVFDGNGSLAGSMALGKGGLGSLTLNTTNAFTGPTTVSNGVLRVNGSLNSSAVTVSSGATIGGNGRLGAGLAIQSGGTLAPGSGPGRLTVSNALTESGGAVNLFELSDDPIGVTKTNDQLTIAGNLNLSGANTILISPLNGDLGVGTYTLINYSGTFSGSLANLSLSGVPGTLTNPPGAIALVVSATRFPTNIVWKGGLAANTWDTQITSNWLNGAATDIFVAGDSVAFGDPGSVSPSVNLAGELNPASVLVNSTNNYTFAGAGELSGAMMLIKTNSGTLTIAITTNDYTGPNFIYGGVLSAADLSDGGLPSAIGASSGDPTNLVIDGGTFRYTGPNLSVNRGVWFGANGARFDISSAGGLTMSGEFAGPGQFTKIGSGTLTLGANNSFAGGILLSNGTVAISQIGALGSGIVRLAGGTFSIGQTKPTNTINVIATGTVSGGSGGGLAGIGKVTGSNTLNVTITTGVFDLIGDLTGFSGTMIFGAANGIRMNGTAGSSLATFDLGSGTVGVSVRNNTGAIALGGLSGGSGTTLAGNSSFATVVIYTVGANNLNTTFAGRIVNGSQASAPATAIVKTGGGTLTLTGTNTYSGVTTISSGTLQVGSGGTAGTLGTGGVSDNATLAFNRSDAIDDTGFGVISGAGNLAKRGAGRLTLSRAHTYSGATTIETGTLALTNSGSIVNSSNVILSAGALLDVSGITGPVVLIKAISGFGAVKGNYYVASRAWLSPGSANSFGTLTFSNALTLFPNFGNPPCTNYFKVTRSPHTNDAVRVFGALTNGGVVVVTSFGLSPLAAGDSFKLFNAASYSGAFYGTALPPLTAGLAWDTSQLNSAGVVKVVVAPPLITSVKFLGGSLVWSGTGGMPGTTYYVLSSTNLTLPLAQWTRAETNQFDGAGNFSQTNGVSAGVPQSFYLLQLP